jgi:ABC-2 type transport system ATP-binding protein
MAAIEVESLSLSYGSRKALDDVSLRVGEGETFALLGPNGGGKTTLFRILSTILRPDSGAACILGIDVLAEPARVRRRIGVVFQSPSLDGKLTVMENVIHHGHLYGLRGRALRRRAEDVLAAFGLTGRSKDLVESLSGGLQRRVEVAKSLLHEPSVLLLDEPSTGLDPSARRDLWERLGACGATVLVTTHILDEAEHAARLAILNEGHLVAAGTPGELKSEIGGEVIHIKARDTERAMELLRSRFHVAPDMVDGQIRVEWPCAHRHLPELFEAMKDDIISTKVGQPTLEDVFVHHTGTRFE